MTWMTPWMIGGGVSHEVEVARLLAYASTGGAEGIVTPGDLRIRPLSTPGGKIRVAPGAALMLNRFPGGTGQTYVGRLPAQEEVSVTATGSAGGRTDLVVARIHDPQYAGPVPPDPQDFSYARTEVIESVPAGTTSARELNLSYPAVALARIDLPNNTATVEASHITDVREVAQPRVWQEARTYFYGEGQTETLTKTSSVGELFPDAAFDRVRIPVWATEMTVKVTWAGVTYPGGNVWGKSWLEFGQNTGSPGPSSREFSTKRMRFSSVKQASGYRASWYVMDTVAIDESLRGELRGFSPMAYVEGGSGDKPVMDDKSGIMIELWFREVPTVVGA